MDIRQLLDGFDFLAEPAAHLRACLARRNGHDAVILHELPHEVEPAAVIHPGVMLAHIHAPRHGGVEHEGRVLADEEARQGVGAFDGAVLRGVEGLERADDFARGENLDLKFETDGEDTKLYLGKEDVSLAIRSPEMDMLSSGISAIKEVRKAMTELQRKIGKGRALVAEGRDMGTVVFPNADHKFFITASPEVRAERRYKERISRGESISKSELERELRKRDHQDETRSIAPLTPAEDA